MIYSIKIKFYVLFLLIIVLPCASSAQMQVFGGWGTATGYTQQSQKMIYSKNDLSLSSMQNYFGLEYQKKRMSFIGAFSFFKGTTMMRISRDHRDGYNGADVTRFDLGCTYNILKMHKKIFIKPFVMLGVQYSKETAVLWGEAVRIFGPDYYQAEIPYSEGYDTTQIVPSLGVRTGVKLYKRLSIGLNIQGVYAFKTYQKIFFNYTYKNDPTVRTAVFDSRGTGLFSTLFLSFDVSNLGKKPLKKPILKSKGTKLF